VLELRRVTCLNQLHRSTPSNSRAGTDAGVVLTGFQLKAADTGETVVGIPSFSAEGAEANLADHRIEIGLVKSTGGSILARQMKDGKINLLGLEDVTTAADTNSPAPVAGATLAGQGSKVTAAKVPAKTARKGPPASESKGAGALMTAEAKLSATPKPPPRASLPAAPDGTPFTIEQIEARLISVIQVSETEQRDLAKQRTQAVQAFILQTGKVTADRLFIVTLKSAGASAKGRSQVNLSLN
jgi:hypothetical protein